PARRVAAVRGWGVGELLVPWPLDALAARGVEAWCAAGGALTLRVALDRGATVDPEALSEALARHRPRAVELYYGATAEGWLAADVAGLAAPADAAAAARRVSALLADRQVAVRAVGLPACVLGTTDPNLWSGPHSPFDERVDGAGDATSLVRAGRERRARVAACATCSHRDLCDGPWRTLVARFGDAAFAPAPNEPGHVHEREEHPR
ncbi:MAG: hypothetical protein CVU56_29725, partial [Deltaproteobacteria bacterium HGW-Deltaproteobacteria-14]